MSPEAMSKKHYLFVFSFPEEGYPRRHVQHALLGNLIRDAYASGGSGILGVDFVHDVVAPRIPG
jgi:hypothetical protein